MYESNLSLNLQQQLSELIKTSGYSHFGITPLSGALSLTYYKAWLEEGFHGSMDYLVRHLPQKENPELVLPSAKSAIVIGFPYQPHPEPLSKKTGLRVAYYARGKDYHTWLKAKLEELISKLKVVYPNEVFLAATDSSPVLERDLAYRAGLGWFGKNTCLIDQARGSLFLIGEILTSLECRTQTALHPDRCGTCRKCIEACPTKALVSPQKLDARLCISYLTIESKEVPKASLRPLIGDNFFGCDICQSVCPWNEKVFGEIVKAEQTAKTAPTDLLTQDLKFILSSSNKELERHFADSPLSRARGFGLKRNAIIVAANQKLTVLKPEIEKFLQDSRLGELAAWALKAISSN